MSLDQCCAPARQRSDRGHAPRPFTRWCHSAADVSRSDRARRPRYTSHTPVSSCSAASERADTVIAWSSRHPGSGRSTLCSAWGSALRRMAERRMADSSETRPAAMPVPLLSAERGRERARMPSASASTPSYRASGVGPSRCGGTDHCRQALVSVAGHAAEHRRAQQTRASTRSPVRCARRAPRGSSPPRFLPSQALPDVPCPTPNRGASARGAPVPAPPGPRARGVPATP